MRWHQVVGTMVAVGALAAGCTSGMKEATGPKALYERLGGKPAIQAVVDDFVGNVAADTRINQRFAGANIPRLKTMLADQICEAAGGPCQYAGRSMKAAHAGMKIADPEFNVAGRRSGQEPRQVQGRRAREERAAGRPRRHEGGYRQSVTVCLRAACPRQARRGQAAVVRDPAVT